MVLVGIVVVAGAGFLALSLFRSPAPAASPTNAAAHGSPTPGSSPGEATASPVGGETPSPGKTPRPGRSPTPAPSDAPIGDVQMPLVPVVGFWSTDTQIGLDELRGALTGQPGRYDRVVASRDDRDAISAWLGSALPDSVEAGDAEAIRQLVRNGALGLMRASDVTPAVRALAIGDAALFGEERVPDISAWPLVINVQAPLDQAWDQPKTWTLLAGGDMFLDRGVYREIVERGKGVDHPFDGGTARVTGHHCCGEYVTTYPIPDIELTGNEGAVRKLTQGADLTIANLENPVPDNWVYHPHDYVFSGNPEFLQSFVNAGVDYVSMANNHIKDMGTQAIADSRKNLEAAGLAYSGAGKNAREAGEIAYLQAKDTRIAIVACVSGMTGAAALADANTSGGLDCRTRFTVPRIEKARRTADLVIVFAHWGIEYDRKPAELQRQLAQEWVDAGADLILGAHSHVQGAIEEIDGTVVLYSLGNLIFDQNWWTDSSESYLAEMTFAGNQLVQLRLHPFVMVDQAMPALLDPAKDDGKLVLKDTREASDHLDW
jgi:poly-gamma-glutamate capsule biosynthesis protein CapA/YwtB (metallophosphatase superfamily)